MLWFAWKLVLLQYRKQLKTRRTLTTRELWFAWKLVLLQYRKQQLSLFILINLVVICLKTRTFAVSQTTGAMKLFGGNSLWFAWKLVLLQYRKQLVEQMPHLRISCDLLENSYFCSIANNRAAALCHSILVVICLKTRTFAVSQTTYDYVTFWRYKLWFAWKLVLLQYRKQHYYTKSWSRRCCDLLENSYFCSIANNNGI